ncbi:MAG: methyl-accepting chemotaxis protein [Arcobacteraceae bacterium]
MFLNMTISKRLYMGFGFMIFLMLLIVAIGVNRVNFIDNTLQEIVEVNSVKQRYAINFRGSVHDRAIAIRDVVLADSVNDDLYKKSIADISKLEKFYAESAKLMDDIFSIKENVDDEEIRILKQIKEIENKTLPMVEYIIVLKNKGQNEEASKLLTIQTANAFTEWLKTINEFIDYQEAKNQIATPKAREVASNFSFMMIVVLIISLIIGTSIAFFISKNLSKSAFLIQDGLNNFFKFVNKETKESAHIELDSTDEFGQMAKMINSNINKTKETIIQDEEFVKDVTRFINELKTGNMLAKLEKDSNTPSLQELKVLLSQLQDYLEHTIARDLNKLMSVLDSYKKEDFTARFDSPYAKVAISINELGDVISNLLKQSLEVGQTLEKSSSLLINNVNTLNSSSSNAAAALEETAAALEEITATVVSNSNNVIKMTNYSNEVSNSAKKGQELARSTSSAMEDITSQVNAINEAISVIDQIAFQTNILSLNAAVEAATAGEAGKGFAVVAQEVRNLASRSAEAAKEIKDIVERATSKANQGKEISGEMIKGYEELLSNIQKTTEMILEISHASKEQEAGITQINDTVTGLDRQTQENASIANQTREIALQTDSIAKEIVADVMKKKFNGKNVNLTKTYNT